MPYLKRRNTGYLLPLNPLPETHKHVCVPVPNDERHIQAFLAQIDMLSYWYTWEQDSAKTGRLAAQAWYEIAMSVRDALYANEGCETVGLLDVRQNTNQPCTLEKLDGEVWMPFANLRLCTPLLRMNGTIQEVSTDGETWTPVTVVAPVITPRIGSASENRCIASANAANVFRQVYEEVDRQFLSGASPYVIATAIITLLALLIFYPIALPLVLEFFFLLYATFETLGSGAYTAEVEQDVKCILYCAATSSSGVVTFNYQEVLAAIQAKETPLEPIWTILAIIMQIVGQDGLNSAGTTTAIASATCEDCIACPEDWCYEFDFKVAQEGWFIPNPPNRGFWLSGQGYVVTTSANSRQVQIKRDFATSYVKQISVTASLSQGGIECARDTYGQLNGTTVFSQSINIAAPMVDGVAVMDVNMSINSITAHVYDSIGTNASGNISKVKITGTGVNPFGTSNCEG